MQEHADVDVEDEPVDITRFTCRDTDGLWIGIERALDNGYGKVFTTDAAGAVTGIVGLDQLRAAVRKGAHLEFIQLGDLAVKWNRESKCETLSPILDTKNHIVDVHCHPEAQLFPVSAPDLSHLELRNLVDAYLSTWISSIGDYVRSFEHAWARKVGVAHGVATTNGTVSLHLALAALGIGEGDEVIVPDFTFAASANSVIHVGGRPVLVDVDPHTWCITADAIERAITPRTRAVMPVHVFGRPAPMTEIAALAKARGLFVIEDCAEAHGARYDGKSVGSFSDIACFSFYGNKIVTTGEGGICLTDSSELAARMRILRDHGMRPERSYWHEEPGFNFRMTNLQAAIGCAQLERMDELIAMRRGVHVTYEAAFAGVPGIAFPQALPTRYEPVVWFSCIMTPPQARAALIRACREANFDLRPFFNSLSSMPAYRHFGGRCPASSTLSAMGVNLPTLRKVNKRIAIAIANIFRRILAPT